MRSHRSAVLAGVLAGLLVPSPAPACTFCMGGAAGRQTLTLREEARGENARLILFGTIANPRLVGGIQGVSDLQIDKVLKSHPFLGDRKVVEVPRYLAVSDPKDPPKYLVFCDVFNNKLDLYRGVPVQSAAAVEYLKGALALDPKDRGKALLYYFDYLEHPDKEIANDAFLEFAKASDEEVGQVAARFSAEKLRKWLKDPQTPEERLALYAFLLGACGGPADADLFRGLLENPTPRHVRAYDGLLGGYIQLRPREGWHLVLKTLADVKKSFEVRFAAVRTLRFYHGWKPADSRTHVLRGLEIVIPQGDLADLGIEDLRRWKIWDLTKLVLEQYTKPSHDAPIVKQTIVRYALACPKPEAAAFVATIRKQDPDLVRDVEESLQFEKK